MRVIRDVLILDCPGRHYVDFPDGGVVRSITFDGNDLLAHVECDDSVITTSRREFNCVNGGWGFEPGGRHVGTVLVGGVPLHVYDFGNIEMSPAIEPVAHHLV